MKAFILSRLREPSTWAGLAMLLGLLGVPAPVIAVVAKLSTLAPDLINLIPAAGAAVVAVALPEARAGEDGKP